MRAGGWLLALLAALGGCAVDRAGRGYVTAPRPPARDTLGAQRLNEAGQRQVAEGDWAAAEEEFRAALEADMWYAPAHNNLGLVLLQCGQAYDAAWEFEYAAKLLPRSAEPRNNLGVLLEHVGHLERAEQYYQEALDLDPGNLEIMGHLARVYVKTGARPKQLKELLEELAYRPADGGWDTWARQWLIRLGSEAPTTER